MDLTDWINVGNPIPGTHSILTTVDNPGSPLPRRFCRLQANP